MGRYPAVGSERLLYSAALALCILFPAQAAPESPAARAREVLASFRHLRAHVEAVRANATMVLLETGATVAGPVMMSGGGDCLGVKAAMCKPCPSGESNDCETITKACDDVSARYYRCVDARCTTDTTRICVV